MAVANGAGAARDGHFHAARRRIHPHRVVVAVVPSRPPADVPVPACAVFVGGGVWVWGCVCSGESEARCECVGVERRQRGERERERERAAENQRSHEQRCTRECVSTARHGCVCVCVHARGDITKAAAACALVAGGTHIPNGAGGSFCSYTSQTCNAGSAVTACPPAPPHNRPVRLRWHGPPTFMNCKQREGRRRKGAHGCARGHANVCHCVW